MQKDNTLKMLDCSPKNSLSLLTHEANHSIGPSKIIQQDHQLNIWAQKNFELDALHKT